jgi:hypothetical protein
MWRFIETTVDFLHLLIPSRQRRKRFGGDDVRRCMLLFSVVFSKCWPGHVDARSWICLVVAVYLSIVKVWVTIASTSSVACVHVMLRLSQCRCSSLSIGFIQFKKSNDSGTMSTRPPHHHLVKPPSFAYLLRYRARTSFVHSCLHHPLGADAFFIEGFPIIISC